MKTVSQITFSITLWAESNSPSKSKTASHSFPVFNENTRLLDLYGILRKKSRGLKAPVICIKNLRRLFKGEPNDPFGQRDAKHNRSENAYRVADVIYQAESFMAHESDQVNEHIGKTE